MKLDALEKANELRELIRSMERIERVISSGKTSDKGIRIVDNAHPCDDIYIDAESEVEFLIVKMLEAGLQAARTIRAIAENDLEKL